MRRVDPGIDGEIDGVVRPGESSVNSEVGRDAIGENDARRAKEVVIRRRVRREGASSSSL